MPYRFSTANINPEHRADAWRAVSSDQFVPLDPTPLGDAQHFGARLVADRFADCGWALISTTRHRVYRTESTITQASPGTLFVNLQFEGSGSLTQDTLTREIQPGDVAIIDTDRPFVLEYPTSMRMACFSVPKSRLGTELMTHVVSEEHHKAGTLSLFLRGLALGGVQTHRHHEELTQQFVALLKRCTRVELYSQSARTVANLREVIEIHLENPRLSTTELASLVHLSRSRLYEVLASENLTVRGMLNEARLDRAEHLLADPTYAHHSVARIAELVGFADVGTFARVFRRRHRTTPGVWRGLRTSAQTARS